MLGLICSFHNFFQVKLQVCVFLTGSIGTAAKANKEGDWLLDRLEVQQLCIPCSGDTPQYIHCTYSTDSHIATGVTALPFIESDIRSSSA